MPETDSQTDRKVRSTWWSVTAFNGEMAVLEDTAHYPEFVVRVYGGREVCPTSGREHFQGAIQCQVQVRMSIFKQWLPTAHLEPARSQDALKAYAMKPETAIGEKVERLNEVQPVFLKAHEVCALIGKQLSKAELSDLVVCPYWLAVNRILIANKSLTSQLMNPSLRNFWLNTRHVWEAEAPAIVLQQVRHVEGPSTHVVEMCPNNEHAVAPCGKDECVECSLIQSPEYISM